MSEPFAVERIVIPGAVSHAAEVVARHIPGTRILLVADENTWVAAGAQLSETLEKFTLTIHRFPAGVHPTLTHAQELATRTAAQDGLIALGAGSINDLTKYAAHLAGKPYIACATAASMNGYTSASASLEHHGLKQSHAATAPRAVIADLNILAAAPPRLARAGLGDALCRSTVEADMLLSHHLRGTEYPEAIFEKLRAHEPALIANAHQLYQPESIAPLMLALLEGGDAMRIYGSSAVASQGEHMIAHTAELLFPEATAGAFHGEAIAVTSVTMRALQQAITEAPPLLKSLPMAEETFTQHFATPLVNELQEYYAEKLLANSQPAPDWELLAKQIDERCLTTHEMALVLTQAELNLSPQAIGLTQPQYEQAVSLAHLTRNRFTFLDIAAMHRTN